MDKLKVCIISPGGLPIPAINGGAVQNLVEMLIRENEKKRKIDLYVTNPEDNNAKITAKELYKNTQFIWIKIPYIIKSIDKLIYNIIRLFFKRKENALSFRNNLKMFYYSYAISRILKKENFDKIIIENNLRNFWTLKFFKNYKKYNGKYFLHLHNIPKSSFGCKNVIQNCEKIFCVSNYVSNEIKKNQNPIGPIPEHKIIIYKNCVDTRFFNMIKDFKIINQMKKTYKITEKDFIIIFAGRLIKEKGALETIEAIKKINNPNIKLLIVGDCYYNSDVKNEFQKKLKEKSLEIKEKIIFTGYIDYSEMHNIYKLGDIAVLPSIWNEPAGMTIIEAMACGLPIITTNSGGIPEYTYKDCAYILERDDKLVENISKSILELYNSIVKRKEMSIKSGNHIKNNNNNKYYEEFIKNIGIKENYE